MSADLLKEYAGHSPKAGCKYTSFGLDDPTNCPFTKDEPATSDEPTECKHEWREIVSRPTPGKVPWFYCIHCLKATELP